jgi:DNA-binding CsgD family transcriptional regulator
LRLGIRLINAEAAQLAFSDALARLGTGVFLVNDAGRVIFANPAAERLAGDGLVVLQGRLTARSASQREALNAALAMAVGRGPEAFAQAPKPVLLHGLDAGRFLALYVLPMRSPSGGAVERLLADASAIVVTTASRADEPIDPALARDLLGLTLSEARLAALVGSGLGPRDASEKLGITEETARTTLKRVFAKAGVSRQNELAALLTRLVLR